MAPGAAEVGASGRFEKQRVRRRLAWAVAGALAVVLGLGIASPRARDLCHGFLHGYRSHVASPPGPTREVTIPGSLRIQADYYAASSEPLVILVHGSAPDAARLGLCRLLATRLQQRGLPVLALDLGGFGRSEDPRLPLEGPPRFAEEVIAGTRHAIASGWARPGKVVYLGHSLGAAVVLEASRSDPRPAGVIAMGAPVFGQMKEQRGPAAFLRFVRQRFADMRLEPDPVSAGILQGYLLSLDVCHQVSAGGLPPTLLIYGENEREALEGTRKCLLDTRPAKGMPRVHVVAGAPHDYHVRHGPFGLVFYDERSLQSLIDACIDASATW